MADRVCNNGNISEKRQKMEVVNKVNVVVGAQFGDEGKGKVVDMLCQTADIVCRCQVSCLCFALVRDN